MRILICMCILSGCLAAQDSAQKSPPPAAKETKKTTPAANAGIPKDAVESSPGIYRWTDKDGKVWMYRQTPFGMKRWLADTETSRPDGVDKRNTASARTTAVEQGDSIRFEQTSPFGKHTWVRKKTDLTEDERKIWDLQQKDATASHSAEKE